MPPAWRRQRVEIRDERNERFRRETSRRRDETNEREREREGESCRALRFRIRSLITGDREPWLLLAIRSDLEPIRLTVPTTKGP